MLDKRATCVSVSGAYWVILDMYLELSLTSLHSSDGYILTSLPAFCGLRDSYVWSLCGMQAGYMMVHC